MVPLHAEALKKRFGLRRNGGVVVTTAKYYCPEELLLEDVVYLFVMLNTLLDPVRRDDQLAFPDIDNCGKYCASMVHKRFLLLHLVSVWQVRPNTYLV